MGTSNEDNWVRRFSVTDTFRHSKGFTLYKITSLVYPKKYPEAVTKIVAWKRYNDFKKLHKELKIRHKKLHLPEEFPPFVKPKVFRRFDADVIEERQAAALKLLEFVGQHSSLFTCDAFVKFFESGYTVECENGSISGTVECRSSSPLNKSVANLGQHRDHVSSISDDDHTSLTTDTDSAISSPVQESELAVSESLQDLSVEDDSWSSRQLQPSQSQTTLSSLASVESIFSRRIQSFKNRLIGISTDNETSQKEAELSKYWLETQKIVTIAEEKESIGDYQTAFNCYKAAIAQLLNGVQNDTDNDRRKLVKEKTAEYLCKAEFIANNFLSRDITSLKKKKSDLIPLSKLWQPLSDLQWFKVVGIVGKVMLVIDSRSNYLFIVKALYKSAYPINKNKMCIFPRRIPYMVELNSIFETDSSVFLVLQYVSGGKLWNHVNASFQKPEETPVKARRNSNPYSCHHIRDSEHISVSTSDSCPSGLHLEVEDCEVRSTVSSPGTSYLDLIRDYTESKNMDSSPVKNEVSSGNVFVSEQCIVDVQSDNSKCEALDTVCDDSISCSKETDLQNSKPPCDVLYQNAMTGVNSEFTFHVEDSYDIETKDLVEHAQRLLQSVDVTLMESENIISRVELNTASQVADLSQRLVVEAERNCKENDRLSVASNHSNKSLDVCRLAPNINSKGSSPLSSIGVDSAQQWCQLESGAPGIAEETVRRWAAQIIVALQALHQAGIICMDLNPENVLLTGNTVRLTYFCSFPGVEPQFNYQARSQLFTAPELASIFPITPAADWWSLGTILYQLLTGQSLCSYYPSGIFCHTILYIPDAISIEAKSLLKQLLKYNPNERLGSGLLGVEEIKSHPFFEGIQWDQIYDDGLLPI